MKKILLPTDFSDNAWNAIFTALKLYADLECKFYLLHAYEPNALNLLGRKGQERLGIIYDSLSQYAEQELDKILKYLKENHQNAKHSFETVSKSDTLQEAVQEMVSILDIKLIVMGTQGATGAKEVFMGSNTVKVLKNVKKCPVLAVPSEYNFQNLKTLVFPTDFTSGYNQFLLSPLTELARLWKSNIQVVHVALEFVLNDQQKKNQRLLKEEFSGFDTVFHDIDFDSNVTHSLENYIADSNVDLIALISYHHSFWEKVIGEPVVKKLTFHTKVPLLILPE